MTPSTANSDPGLEADAQELHAALSELVRVYQFRDRDRICCHDVSVTQCHALEALLERGPLTLSALAGELFLDKSTASRVVATLERKGYAARATHPEDSRAVLLTATAAGRELCRRIEHQLVLEERELVADLEPEVRRGAALLLRRLARAARRRSGLGGEQGEPACCCES
ncbi:MAG: MarR family transcriptional regulator [Thermoanaerobaculia bacterium]|mgnify:CR=1 FL=1